jgi:hypothetical protein
VASLTSVDPVSAMGEMKANVGGRQMTIKLKSELSDVKYRFADGTEVPARVVLKDPDLDLAFIAPEKPLDDENKGKFAVIKLAGAAKKAGLLDRIISLGRLSKDLNYTPTVRLGRVAAVVTKPRTFYLGAASLGSPVFTGAGKLLGICVSRSKGGSGRGSGMQGNVAMTPVILPAEDVQEIATQAAAEMNKAAKKKAD